MEKYYLKTMSAQIYENTLYFVSSEMNLIFKYSLEDDSISFIDPPKENLMGKSLYGNIEVIGSDVYLIPFCANSLWKLCQNGKWEEVVFPDKSPKNQFFMGTVRYGDFLYVLGYEKAKILKIDTKNNEIKSIQIDIDCIIDVETGCFGYDYEIVNEKIYLPIMCSNSILEMDCKSDNIKILNVPSGCHGYAGIAYDGNGFWLAPRKGKCFVYVDTLFKEVKEFSLPEEYRENEHYFGGALVNDNKICFTSFSGKNMEFNCDNPFDIRMYKPGFFYYKKLQNGRCVISENEGETYYIDATGIKRALQLSVKNNMKLRYIKDNIYMNPILHESKDMGLDSFINMLSV